MNEQELLDKYIKYNSKITFDIFKLMYQKLIDLGFTSPHTVENAFKEFSGKYPYFVMSSYSGELFFNQYADNFIKCPEISLKDLLGYNPFESFTLPEQWCIKVQEMKNTPEEIVNWRLKIVMCGTWVSPGYLNNHGYHSTKINQEYTELSLEQFKQYVLKESLISKPIKPFPTHWCIELNKETIPIVGVYYNKKHLSDPTCDAYTGDEAIGYYVLSHNNNNEYVKNGYNYCSFFGEPSDSYPEITLEQFKEFIMNEPVKIKTSKTEKDWSKATKEELIEEAKRRYPVGTMFISAMNPEFTYEVISSEFYDWLDRGTDIVVNNSSGPSVYCRGKWAEVVSLSESKVESTIEYAECIEDLYGLKVGQIYEVRDKKIGIYRYPTTGQFRPSTKEAFEAQNKPNSIEKWSVGSYIVPLQNKLLTRSESLIKGKPYQIIKNIGIPYIICETGIEINFCDDSDTETTEGIKWFATKSEAEEFAKTLIDPIKDTIECETCNGEGHIMTAKLYPSGHTEVNETCPDCNGDGFIDKPKQLLKQAVHCKTQEEWDFVTKKLGYKWTIGSFNEDSSWISLNSNQHSSENYWKKYGYQILSFQEWCDLNEYKMKKTRFQAGDYVVSLRPENLSTHSIKSNYCYIQYRDEDEISIESGATMYETDFNYARLATPEEIEEYKRIGKPYDVTTLQSPTINTYGLNIGDKLDSIIIAAWEKKGFNYFSDSKEVWVFGNGMTYNKNRKIESFKIMHGVVGFLVSGTLGIYLRAEGFKEFADNYYTETTSNFKVGSWYKYNEYYLKYSKTNDENIFIASEYIDTEDNTFKDKLTNFKCGIADGSKELVTDLSVIQQYLPEGHPDKIIKNPIFEAGKWYKNLGTCNNTYGKFLKLNNSNQFWVSEYIYQNEYSKDSGWFFYSSDTVECSLEEIQKFLPEGHPNKFIRLNGIPMEIKIEANSFYGSTLVQRSQFNKEEIYLLPDPD